MALNLKLEDLAGVVVAILGEAAIGTVVTIGPSGTIETSPPGAPGTANGRREPLITTFVASSSVPSEADVLTRLRQGVRKQRRERVA